MNCDECKEQVLELIERESIDPEGVREILAKCPDCRAEFDQMKTALEVAGRLPVEAPPTDMDEQILKAAEARAPTRRRPIWNQPLAMAAVALLAVGIGISTVTVVTKPAEKLADARFDDAQLEQDETETPAAPAEPQEARTVESKAVAEVGGEGLAGTELAAAEPPAAEEARPARKRAPKKKEARRASRQAPAPAEAEEELALADANVARDQPEEPASFGAANAKSTSPVASAAERGARAPEQEAIDHRRRCADTIAAFEKRLAEDDSYEPTPEKQLDAGRCYQTLGKRKQARRWLKRAAEHPSTSDRANEALKELE